ncbi:MAG: LysE family translocator [Desulfovibrionaceae bacterium]|nr:LysE family translocator [Desulfovibrionaceae bacterium]
MLPFETAFSFFSASLLLAAAPGPDILFVLTSSILYGVKKGMALVLGLFTGVFGHLIIISLGTAVLLAASPYALLGLKCVGALYLLRIAWLTFRNGSVQAETAGTGVVPGTFQLFLRGIVMNMTNPKVLLFMLAFLPQFCSPEYGSITGQIFFLGLIFQLSGILVFTCVVLLGGKLAGWLNRSPMGQKILNMFAAAVLVMMAVMIFFF